MFIFDYGLYIMAFRLRTFSLNTPVCIDFERTRLFGLFVCKFYTIIYNFFNCVPFQFLNYLLKFYLKLAIYLDQYHIQKSNMYTIDQGMTVIRDEELQPRV